MKDYPAFPIDDSPLPFPLEPVTAWIKPRKGGIWKFGRRLRCILFGHRQPWTWLSLTTGKKTTSCGYCGVKYES